MKNLCNTVSCMRLKCLKYPFINVYHNLCNCMILINVILHLGSPWWVFLSGKDCEPEEGASALSGHHHCWGEGLSQPAARLHHKCSACWLFAPRWYHQKRYKFNQYFNLLSSICLCIFCLRKWGIYMCIYVCVYIYKSKMNLGLNPWKTTTASWVTAITG